MLIAEITIAVLLGVLVIVSGIYLTHFSLANYKLAKQRAENGDYFEEDEKKHKVFSIILISYLALSATIFGINLYYRSSPVVKDQYYVSIRTDSMSQALSSNTYLKNYKLDNQIAQYDIAVFDKLFENNIEKYDIILFKKDNILIAHRVVEITDDGLFYIQIVRCLGCCGLAPVVVVNGKTYGRVTPLDAPKIIKEWREEMAKKGE